MKKLIVILLCITMVGSLFAGCGGSGSSGKSDTIKIGSVHPLSGSMAYEGQALVNAQKLAVKEINDAGGIKALDGKKLELVAQDNQGDASVATSSTQSLINDGVVALTGTFTSATCMTATQEAEKAKMPFVVTVASATDLMDKGYKYSFRIQPNVDTYCADFIEYLKEIKEDDLKTAAIIHEDSTYGTSIAEYIEKNIGDAGVEVIGNVAYSAAASSLSSEVTRLSQMGPDILIPIGYYADQSLMMKEIVERKVEFPMTVGVANGAFSDAKFVRAFGSNANDILDVNYSYNPNSDKTKTLLESYKETFKDDMPVHAVYGYESIKVIADALERSGDVDSEALRAALAETDMDDHVLPQKNIKFDETGENINAASVLVQIQDGKRVIVYPKAYAEGKYQK